MVKPSDVLWERLRHTEAKHQLLRDYLDAWIGIIGQRFDNAILIDGFAGPGEYLDHEPGSPMLMLDAFLRRKDRETLRPTFHFLFVEADKGRHDHLRSLIANRKGHPKVNVRLVNDDFSLCFGRELQLLNDQIGEVPPTFAFIDPFGAGNDAVHLASSLIALPRCEALMYVPINHLARFVCEPDLEATLDKLYPDGGWKRARDVTDLPTRCQILQDAMVARLEQSCDWVRPFEIVPDVGKNRYTLFFGTNSPRGLQRMKDAMWKLDPNGGLRFTDSTTVDHPVLFEPRPDLARLENLLRDHFGTKTAGIESLADFTLKKTAFRDNGHLKPLLKAAEGADRLEIVKAKPNRRPGTFPEGTVVRFRQ